MNLSLEGLPLLILFLLPGVFVFHTKQYLNPGADYKYEPFELGLLSLGYSTIISVAQALLFSLLLHRFYFSYFSGMIATPVNTALRNPIQSLALMLCWILLSLCLALVVGWYDPYHAVLRKLPPRDGVSDTDIWLGVLRIKREKGQSELAALANVRLKSGDRKSVG